MKMKTTKWIMAIMGVLLLLMLSGCVDEKKTTISSKEYNIDGNATTKIVELEPEKTCFLGICDCETRKRQITGIILDIEFNLGEQSVFVFKNGFVTALYPAENFDYVLNKTHIITVSGKRTIVDVQIIE
ncbi:hypothetical protein KAS79_00830 [Candidatus Parcubacteria bacterium]|nr:hypothetical protein [Candidatus Parcubacteria bacterium]